MYTWYGLYTFNHPMKLMHLNKRLISVFDKFFLCTQISNTQWAYTGPFEQCELLFQTLSGCSQVPSSGVNSIFNTLGIHRSLWVVCTSSNTRGCTRNPSSGINSAHYSSRKQQLRIIVNHNWKQKKDELPHYWNLFRLNKIRKEYSFVSDYSTLLHFQEQT